MCSDWYQQADSVDVCDQPNCGHVDFSSHPNSGHVDVSRKLNSGHVDVARKPNFGHVDVSREPTITRISASKADLKLKKASAEFFTPFAFLRGSITMIYQFFSDHGRVPLIPALETNTSKIFFLCNFCTNLWLLFKL